MIHDPHLWVLATKAALVSMMLIVLVYRIARGIDRRRRERKKVDHYRLLVDLGEARRVVAKIARPPHGLINRGDAGRLLPADGGVVVDLLNDVRADARAGRSPITSMPSRLGLIAP